MKKKTKSKEVPKELIHNTGDVSQAVFLWLNSNREELTQEVRNRLFKIIEEFGGKLNLLFLAVSKNRMDAIGRLEEIEDDIIDEISCRNTAGISTDKLAMLLERIEAQITANKVFLQDMMANLESPMQLLRMMEGTSQETVSPEVEALRKMTPEEREELRETVTRFLNKDKKALKGYTHDTPS